MLTRLAVAAGTVLLLCSAIVPANARSLPQEKKDDARPAQQAKPAPAKKPAPKAANPAPAPKGGQAYGGAYHGGVRPTEPTNGGVHPSGVPQHAGQVSAGFAQSKAGSWNTDHRTWAQRGGYNGYRIPDSRFKMYFGPAHFFVIGRLPIVFVGGSPRFQYDGYWITILDPWPGDWAATWYDTDDLYLDYVGDGYYLYDRNHPGIGLAVTISF